MLRLILLTLLLPSLLLMALPASPAETTADATSGAESKTANLPLGVQNVLGHRQLPTDTLSLFVFNLDQGSIELSVREYVLDAERQVRSLRYDAG